MTDRTHVGKRVDGAGRAYAGSQLQLQLYVNRRRSALDSSIMTALGLSSGHLEWISPIERDAFKEYKDAAFLRALGLAQLTDALRKFWPASGPRWDGLARTSGPDSSGVVLVEAKNYPREVRGGGCKAGEKNNARTRIKDALGDASVELGIDCRDCWMGSQYQYANRLAHVTFLRRNNVEAFLVNVCFFGDPHRARSTSESEWRYAATAIKAEVGFGGATPSWLADVFLPVGAKAELFGPAI